MANSFLDKTGLGLVWAQIKLLLAGKVDKVDGKGLSSNDYTADEKAKLANIQAGAEANVNADWNAVTGDAAILNKPTIPTATSDLTNDSGFITAQDVPEAVTVDDALDGTSTNPVENQVVSQAIDNVAQFFTGLSEYVTSSQLTSFNDLFSCDFIYYSDGDNNVYTYLFAQGWNGSDYARRFKSFDGMVQVYYHPRDYYWYVTLDGGNSRVMIDPSTNEDEYCQKITAYKWGFKAVPDWNANYGENGYIQNRTHYKVVNNITTIIPEQTVTIMNISTPGTITNIQNIPTAGQTVVVELDGFIFEVEATQDGDNIILSNSDFYISIPQSGDGAFRTQNTGSYAIKAYIEDAQYYKLNNKYLNIDDALDETSENPVANEAITVPVNTISNYIKHIFATTSEVPTQDSGDLFDYDYITFFDETSGSYIDMVKSEFNNYGRTIGYSSLDGKSSFSYDRYGGTWNYTINGENPSTVTSEVLANVTGYKFDVPSTSDIPTNNNQLTNGAGYQTASDVNALIATAVGDLEGVDFEIVQTLPATGDKSKIYLVPLTDSETDNIYEEYIWITSASDYEKIGTTSVDLSDYYNTTNLVPITSTEINTICQ